MVNELINVINENGELLVSSREVASNFGKDHSKVLRSINDKISTNPILASSKYFIESTYVGGNGENRREYLLTRDGFSFIVMGFTGAKADEWKLKYIDAFNKMEQLIKENQLQLSKKQELQLSILNGSDIERITSLKAYENLVVEEATKPLIETIETNKPLVDFAETIASNVDSIEIGLFAKLLKDENINMGRNKLFEYLRDNGYLMKSNTPYQKHIDNKYFEVIEYSYKTPYGDKLATKTLITGKGQIKLLEKLRRSEI